MPQITMKLSIVLAVLLSSALFAAEEKKEEKTSDECIKRSRSN